jgi:opacity protein-like surface antigen
MIVLDENPHDGNFILSEDDEGRLSRDNVIIASGAGSLQPGTVLGKLTASGKFVPSPATAADGSETAVVATTVTRPGWTVGGGVEWAFWDNWSAKAEYDFYDFGTRNLTFPGTIFGVPEVVPGVNIEKTISTVKFGVNYRFGAY